MSKVELSIFIEANYPSNNLSIAMRKPRVGVGINDARYMTTPIVDGKQVVDPAYMAWFNMLKRAYDPKFHEKQPTYSDVTVCKDWHSFSAFRAWWLDNYREGEQLDKDLLGSGTKNMVLMHASTFQAG